MLFTLLAVIMLFGTNTAASASSTELANVDSRSTSQEHVIQSATKESATSRYATTITIADVDLLMAEQSQAIIAGDSALVAKIAGELDSIGVKEVSLGEVLALTGGEAAYGAEIAPRAQSDITFQTAYSSITQ